MKLADVRSSTYIDFDKEYNTKNPEFKVGDHVRKSKYKNTFAEFYVPNWSEEVLWLKKLKNIASWTHVIEDRVGEDIAGTFYEKLLQNVNQKELRVEKVIKRKDDEL